MKQWYYSQEGLQQGQVPETELLEKIRSGEVGGSNLVWHEGMVDWIPLSEMPELRAGLALPVADAPAPSISLNKAEITLPPRESGGSVPLPQPPAYHGNYVAPQIPTYMWQSVVATVVGLPFCCLLAMPFGIVAIVFASKVEGLRVQGDILGATTASKNAKTWMIISFATSALSLVFQVLNILLSNVR